MTGTANTTGKHLSGIEHLKQSIRDILTTPLGSRVMRREYGSRLFQLIDAPLNADTLIDLYAATAEALQRWEPRFQLETVKADLVNSSGQISISLTGIYLPDGKPITMEGIIL
jgi:Bacteriophage baseplate protein W